VLSKLQREPADPANWTQYLTSLERDTQAVLAGLIADEMQKRLPAAPTVEDLRQMASYTLIVGWLVLASLLEKYAPTEDDGEDGDDIDF
jgi:hypothetical protein